MIRRRPELALVLAVAACGGPGGPVAPQDRARARIVRCRAAPPLPTLAAETRVYGGLMGEEIGSFSGGTLATLDAGLLRAAPLATPPPGRRATAVALGAPQITGALAPTAITRVLQHRVGELAACAAKDAALLASGPARSKAVVAWRFTIGATGKVIQADVTSHVLSAGIAACVTGVVRGASFPAPPDGRVVAVTLPIAFDATGAPPAPPEIDPGAPWTPFALDPIEAEGVSAQVARATEGALRGRLAAIDACFASSPVTGSLRAMLAVDADGALTSVRAGGLGEKTIEACVENAVTGMRVMLPSEVSGELACDLSRGDARPWRVTADRGGYGVVEISRAGVRHGDQALAPGAEPDTLTDHAIYLLVADADAPGAMLSLAMTWTRDAEATLVAVRPAPPAGPAPQLLGVGYTAAADAEGEEDPARATLEVGARAVTACASLWKHEARLADPAAIDAAAQKLAARCRSLACPSSLVIAVGRDAAAKDLVEVVGAARRAGFERVLLMRAAGEGDDEEPPGASCASAIGEDEP